LPFKPGKRFFEAVLNLQGSADFAEIKKELEAYHLDAGIHFPRVDGNQLVKLQGSTAFVMEFLANCDPEYARHQLIDAQILEAQTKLSGQDKPMIPF